MPHPIVMTSGKKREDIPSSNVFIIGVTKQQPSLSQYHLDKMIILGMNDLKIFSALQLCIATQNSKEGSLKLKVLCIGYSNF